MELKCGMCGYKTDSEENLKGHNKEVHDHMEHHMEEHGYHGDHH